VNGNPVGGYVGPTGEVPNPVVISAESGYPVTGWLKHNPGATQMSGYLPNYTSEELKYNGIAPALDPVGGANLFAGQHLSISTWCAACHEAYDNKGAAVGSTEFYDYGDYERASMTGIYDNAGVPTSIANTGTASIGNRARHRHPVNISLASGVGPTRALQQEVITSTVLPLEDGPDPGAGTWSTNDYMGCLTCHRAHGSASTMTGWAEARYITNASAVVTWMPEKLAQPTTSGVNPNFSAAILRTNNRGVCERCHNK
jgi:mono/diheme cytochrome c family protein